MKVMLMYFGGGGTMKSHRWD